MVYTGKKLVCFIDDFNMPAKSVFGFLPPLELLKLWADNGFWYDREKQEVKNIKDMQLISSMAPPGGGRNAFSQRVQVGNQHCLVLLRQPLSSSPRELSSPPRELTHCLVLL
eukprot:7573555-Pyramimonas_sp.AAC.1